MSSLIFNCSYLNSRSFLRANAISLCSTGILVSSVLRRTVRSRHGDRSRIGTQFYPGFKKWQLALASVGISFLSFWCTFWHLLQFRNWFRTWKSVLETTWYNTGFKSTVDGSFGKTHTHNVTKFTHGVREKVRERLILRSHCHPSSSYFHIYIYATLFSSLNPSFSHRHAYLPGSPLSSTIMKVE